MIWTSYMDMTVSSKQVVSEAIGLLESSVIPQMKSRLGLDWVIAGCTHNPNYNFLLESD